MHRSGKRRPAGPARAAAAAALLVATAGCGLTDPFIFRGDEFNRESPTFNQPIPDGQPISICYSPLAGRIEAAEAIARTQCARFDKQAALLSTDVARCPLLTPVEAMFTCVAVAEAAPPAPVVPTTETGVAAPAVPVPPTSRGKPRSMP
jgi:hypothetical protein